MPRLVEGQFPRDSHLNPERQINNNNIVIIIIIIITEFSSLQLLGLPTD
jgi:hypothetical protein